MKKIALAFAAGIVAATLGGCATTATAQSTTERADWDLIEFETKAWGRLMSGWSIGPLGQGAWWVRESDSGEPGPSGPYHISYHEFDIGPAGFAQVSAMLDGLPDPVQVATDCENFRTDDAYGTLRQTIAATTREIAWNNGCQDADYVAFMDKLKAADTLIASAGRAAPVQRIEYFDTNGQGLRMEFPGESGSAD